MADWESHRLGLLPQRKLLAEAAKRVRMQQDCCAGRHRGSKAEGWAGAGQVVENVGVVVGMEQVRAWDDVQGKRRCR